MSVPTCSMREGEPDVWERDVLRSIERAETMDGWTLAHAALVFDMLQKAKDRLGRAFVAWALPADDHETAVRRADRLMARNRDLNWWTHRWLLVPERMRLRVARGI